MGYASGKFAYGLCDYCGQRYPLNILQKNWQGYKVCPEDYEPKEPQLEPLKYNGDAVALYQPRPDRVEPMVVYLANPGNGAFQSIGSVNGGTDMRPYPELQNIVAYGGVGQVTVTTT